MPANPADIFTEIPADTSNAALLVIRNGNFYLTVGQLANSLLSNLDLEIQASQSRHSAQELGLLYLMTIFQYLEKYSDEQAAEALRSRVDWKYALHQPLANPGLSKAVLCEFRHWLLDHPQYLPGLHAILKQLSELTQAIKKPRLYDGHRHIVNQICLHNQLFILWMHFRQVLRILAAEHLSWLSSIYQPHWYERYELSTPEWQLTTSLTGHLEITPDIGQDGFYLLDEVTRSNLPSLVLFPEIVDLKTMWEVQFERKGAQVLWRTTGCARCQVPAYLVNPKNQDQDQDKEG